MTGAACTGAILAGGRSTRYGGAPKGLEMVGGRRIIDRVADALAEACDTLLVVANDARAADWLPGVRLTSDRLTDAGSVAGIHAALVEANGPVLVVAWDMPFVTGSLLRELRDQAPGHDAVVPESGSRRGLEPLCAWYGPACVPAIERRLAEGDRRVIAFYDEVRMLRLPADAVRRHGDPETMFMNVNSPDELGLAEGHATTTDHLDRRPQA